MDFMIWLPTKFHAEACARKRRGRFGGEGIKTKMGTEENQSMLRELEVNQAEDVVLASSTSDVSDSSGHPSHSSLSMGEDSVNDLSSSENTEFAFEPNSKLLRDFTSIYNPC